jgi:hypothetical protein
VYCRTGDPLIMQSEIQKYVGFYFYSECQIQRVQSFHWFQLPTVYLENLSLFYNIQQETQKEHNILQYSTRNIERT